ncbi:OmpA family protein [Aureispira sp. CCB-E]|uniref:OmpA family protein n=1 Tax=Aureispira sp. CCB-E TaxID=3051121 RepID=UPI002868EB7A|nr:OmpA family protein [Aureispira sp. CCB-E]WMX14678.1 OmpA family protein [Aureispira sp. CCB-E]
MLKKRLISHNPMMNYQSFLIFFFVLTSIFAQAQNNELAQANTLFKAFLFKEAIPLYETALEKDPYLGDAMVNLAKCYYYTNNATKAETWYARILRYDGYKQYAFDYGQVLKMNGKYAEAKRWFNTSTKDDHTRGMHYAKSCDFATGTTLLSNIYKVKALPKLNSKSADFAPTLYDSDLIFSSSRSVAVEKQGQVAWTNDAFNQHYMAEKDAQGFISTGKALRSFIGNDINDAPMSYLPSVDMVAITSNNFMDGIRHINGSGLMMDIYLYNSKSKKEWDHNSEQFFPFNANVDTKTPFSTGHPCLRDNGTTLYFCSNKAGGYGGYDIYVSRRTATGWSMPENLGHPINTPGNEMSPFVDDNGRLYFSSDWHLGYGGMDVFTANRYAYGWGNVENMGNQVNSPSDDMYFVFDTERKIGYLSSNRPGGRGNEDIYQVIQTQDLPRRQSLALNIGDKFVLDDRYFRPGDGTIQNTSSQQLFDILQRLIDNPTAVIQINGYTDAAGTASNNLTLSKDRANSLLRFFTSKGIDAKRIRSTGYGESFLVNRCSDDVPCSAEERAANRRIEIFVVGIVDVNGVVSISYDAAPAPNAEKIVEDAVTRAVASKKAVSRSSSSSRSSKPQRKAHYAIGDVIEVASVFYELSKSKIDERKSPGLKQLLEILKEHEHVVIEIGAHTDASGSSKYNQELSEKRAKEVKKYLEKKGIASSRLVAKGYGESKLLNKCKDGVKCSDSEHAQNRRTEFKVIGQKGFAVGDIIKVDNINYELNKDKLDMKDSRGLTEIIELLKNNKISVEIRSHTDSRGSSKYNQELSEKRAKAVYNYLVKNGISKYRLKYKGYGESKLLNKCKDGVRCSDSDHAKNRRTDFKVIGLR